MTTNVLFSNGKLNHNLKKNKCLIHSYVFKVRAYNFEVGRNVKDLNI